MSPLDRGPLAKALFEKTTPLLKFTYVNWRGAVYEYVIDPDGTVEFNTRLERTVGGVAEQYSSWVLSGYVVTRDGDPRLELGDNRRRSFEITKMSNIQEVERSAHEPR